ncbi:MAG: site-2 protease family protein [Nitrospirae bacterium]|nr:MAG: site-2 protease family protein [Nitrospirota bacterium]
MELEQIIRQVAISAVPILIAIILHEVSHGYVAWRLGDPTAKMLGRLTLNPVSHIDPFGTVIMPIMLLVFSNGQFMFGYAKPVPINPANFKNPKRDMAISAAAGPVANLIVAAASIITLKYILIPSVEFFSAEALDKILKPVAMMLTASVTMNVILASFNLLPIPPLDGGRVIMGFLPYRQAAAYSKIEPYGMIIVLLLVATGFSSYLIMPLARLFMNIIGML